MALETTDAGIQFAEMLVTRMGDIEDQAEAQRLRLSALERAVALEKQARPPVLAVYVALDLKLDATLEQLDAQLLARCKDVWDGSAVAARRNMGFCAVVSRQIDRKSMAHVATHGVVLLYGLSDTSLEDIERLTEVAVAESVQGKRFITFGPEEEWFKHQLYGTPQWHHWPEPHGWTRQLVKPDMCVDEAEAWMETAYYGMLPFVYTSVHERCYADDAKAVKL